MKNTLACCYHPTTTVLIDDDEHFLDGITVKLGNQVPSKAFYSPLDALSYLEKELSGKNFLQHCINQEYDEDPDHVTIDINLRKLHECILDPNRFSQVSLLIIDYFMPTINGIELCEKIKDQSVQKMILTGEADENEAIRAFNKGLIHKFVMKNNKLPKTLKPLIEELQENYFTKLTERLLQYTKNLPGNPLSCLTDPQFIDTFKSILIKNKIVEYYLLSQYGDFLLIDQDGNAKILVVKSEEDMEGFEQIAKLAENPSNGLVEQLTNRKVVPYFHTEVDLQTPPEGWEPFVHKADAIQGKKNYYYSLVSAETIPSFQIGKFTTYQEFINQ